MKELLKDEAEIKRRLCEGLTGPTLSLVLDRRLVDIEAVRKVILKYEVGNLIDSRLLPLKGEAEQSFVLVIRLKEKECVASCDEKCGSRDTMCFGDCFFECLSSIRDEVESKLCR
ncbi:MAG: hypothetical protein GU347_04410 [Desulfurococcales archaeon]|nr:hypothetical protein [Desulfurococcales archaeon]